MEKKFILKGLDCPHCSSEIEREISRMDGIIDASITLFNQTLTVKTNVAETDGLYEKIKAVVKKHQRLRTRKPTALTQILTNAFFFGILSKNGGGVYLWELSP